MTRQLLLIITGSIAAYKACDLIRRAQEKGWNVRAILTRGAEQFITPLTIAALSENPAYTDLFSLKDEVEMGHIRLTREADCILVAPASADFLAKMRLGIADDLASTALLAADKPIFVAPAMNVKMWEHPATQEHIATLQSRGVRFILPGTGVMACGEEGMGRMPETADILAALDPAERPLKGMRALITSGPTYEPLDPVRFLGNRSSGKQGHAIAKALADAGAEVTLITGPVTLPDPSAMRVVHIETAEEMKQAVLKALPADIAVCAAAVGDWRAKSVASAKIKKRKNQSPPTLQLAENPDILASLAKHAKRPKLLIGFAAETEKLLEHARGKLKSKGCDWIVANSVAKGAVFGEETTEAWLVAKKGETHFPKMDKTQLAEKLVLEIAEYFKATKNKHDQGE